MNEKIAGQLFNCERAGFYQVNKPDKINQVLSLKKEVILCEFKQIAFDIIKLEEGNEDNTLKFDVPFKTKFGEEAIADVIIESKNQNVLIVLIPTLIAVNWIEIQTVAYKYFVITNSGYKIDRVLTVRIREDYLMADILTSEYLFINDVTIKVRQLQIRVVSYLKKFKFALKNNAKPNNQISHRCIKPNVCPFKEHCFNELLPDGDNIFEMNDINFNRKLQLYWKGYLKLRDLPSNFVLDSKSEIQIASAYSNKIKIKKDELKLWFLKTESENGVWFLDFEYNTSLKPIFKGGKPMQIYPFVYSLYYLDFNTGSKSSFSYIINNKMTIVELRKFHSELLNHLSLMKNSKIVVYNKKKIAKALNNISELLGKNKDEIKCIINNIVDLNEIFRSKIYYHPKFRGSTYLKDVVKVLCPEINYEELLIKSGEQAEYEYKNQIVSNGKITTEIKTELTKYCSNDALSILKVYLHLRELVREKK